MLREFREFITKGNARTCLRQVNKMRRQEAPPATKECPYCFSPIAVKATRCPQCTSSLLAAEGAR
ncbi:MAG TPA: hypothetical protein VJ206_05925 [bacterium]|nr:hypothetical protein [bacterium]